MDITIEKIKEKTFKKSYPCSMVGNEKTLCKTEM